MSFHHPVKWDAGESVAPPPRCRALWLAGSNSAVHEHTAAESVSSSRQLRNQLKISTRRKTLQSPKQTAYTFCFQTRTHSAFLVSLKLYQTCYRALSYRGMYKGKFIQSFFFFFNQCRGFSSLLPRGSQQHTAHIVNVGQSEVSRVWNVSKIYSLVCF